VVLLDHRCPAVRIGAKLDVLHVLPFRGRR
jgi:hypothetical protein